MANQKWKPIHGCSNYRIGSNGDVKRLKHRSNGKKHVILKEKIVEKYINKQSVVYVNLINDLGKSKIFSLKKLVVDSFLEKGHTYYKVAPDFQYGRYGIIFNISTKNFVRSDVYDRMKFKPTIYKTIRL